MASDKDTLVEFGFSALRAEKAIKATNGSGLQQALDWLEAHANDADIDDPITEEAHSTSTSAAATATTATAETTAEEQPSQPAAQAESLKCNECGKHFATPEQAEYHATKSGHLDFSESTERVKELTAEEKKQKLEELQAKLREKRKKKEQEEAEEQRLYELNRRKQAQESLEQKEKMKAEMQMREFAQQKKDRELDRLARQKVKQQIEQDKRDRAARFAKEKAEREGLATTSQQQQQQDGAVKPSLLQAGLPKVSSNTGMARLQFRPMVKSVEGIQPFTHVFNAEDTLDQVVEFVKEKTGIKHFHLATTFPKKVFGTHHYSKTLKELGLAPSAALAMTD